MLRKPNVNNLKISEWVDQDAFVGLYRNQYGTHAIYAWQKEGEASFMLYFVDCGTIEKFGRVKAEEIDALALDRPTQV